MRDVFIVGAKGLGNYGGYETFLERLTEKHNNKDDIQYHIACKKNGKGYMNIANKEHVCMINKNEFMYNNAHCFLIKAINIGSAQAILYDLKSLIFVMIYIQKSKIEKPIIYVLSSRVGPFISFFSSYVHKKGGLYFNNPDGRESLRSKYSPVVKKYWSFSESLMVKYSDLVVCDSKCIESYIKEKYKKFNPKTAYISYGAEVYEDKKRKKSKKYMEWLKANNLKDGFYFVSVGRFVPENNFETMIREFMKSNTEKDFAIITNINKKFYDELNTKLSFVRDKRIKFVGTVYDADLLKEIRENAFAYIHGHEVGGTNPSLLEALSLTKLNLVYDVNFNREVCCDSALYWNKKDGFLSAIINSMEYIKEEEADELGRKAKKIIKEKYNWQLIADDYEKLFK